MVIEITKNQNGCWFWRLVADNLQILAHSETYSSKAMCLKTVKSISKQLGISYEIVSGD